MDRQTINQIEMLGLGRPTGSFVPPEFDFALKIDPPAYDPKRAKQFLVEAGYPNGFDAGDLAPLPPYTGAGRGRRQLSSGHRDQVARADDGARRLPRELAGEEATRIADRRHRGGRQCRRTARALRDQERHLRVRDGPGPRGPVRAPGAESWTESSARRCSISFRKRSPTACSTAPIFQQAFIWGVGPRVQEAGGRSDPGLCLHGARRGPQGEALTSRRPSVKPSRAG